MPSLSSPRPESPTAAQAPPFLQAPWQVPRRSLSNGGRNSGYATNRTTTFRDNIINSAERMQRRLFSAFGKLTLLQRILSVAGLLSIAVLGILFLTFSERIFASLAPAAEKWQHTTGGWIVLWLITFTVALPPLMGYSTCATLAGFVYGVPKGWLIIASATVAGSFFSFILSRTLLKSFVERIVANDKRFAALTLVIKTDGLKLLCMIRLCPLPYSLSNGAMSTFPTIHPAMYALATAIVTPKLLVHIFIGSRLAAIARSGEKMTAGTRLINYISIAVGMCVGMGTGYYIYQKTMDRARQLAEEEADNTRDTTRSNGAPPKAYVDDPEAQIASTGPARDGNDDDDVDYFDYDSGAEDAIYRDQSDTEDVFGQGDGQDNEPAIGMNSQKH